MLFRDWEGTTERTQRAIDNGLVFSIWFGLMRDCSKALG